MKLVAVTSCPTGIAHSEMAAESLETTAEDLGHEIRVEVQGAMGAEDELTAEEIEAADAVIIAADTSVQQDRFEGKPLVKAGVQDAINDTDALIERAVERAEDAEGAAAESSADDEAGGDDATTLGGSSSSADDGNGRDADESHRDREPGLFERLINKFT